MPKGRHTGGPWPKARKYAVAVNYERIHGNYKPKHYKGKAKSGKKRRSK